MNETDARELIRSRTDGVVPAPRGPFAIGVSEIGDDLKALVVGPSVNREYRWRPEGIFDGDRLVAMPARAMRLAVDARVLADTIVAEVASGPWLRYQRTYVQGSGRGGRVDYTPLRDQVLVGRGADVPVRFSSGTVARHHCRFERVGERCWVEDLESTNGTWLHGQRIGRAELSHGDIVGVAGYDVTFLSSLVPRPRAFDVRDDKVWSQLFLDRIELGVVELDPPRYATPEDAQPVPKRAGAVEWRGYVNRFARDERWLFEAREEAEVFADVVLARERDEEVPAPIVGDLCACYRGEGRAIAIVRVDRMVARIELRNLPADLDAIATRIVGRAMEP